MTRTRCLAGTVFHAIGTILLFYFLVSGMTGCAYVRPTPGSTRAGISATLQYCLNMAERYQWGLPSVTRECLLDSHAACEKAGLEPTCALDWAMARGYMDPAWIDQGEKK